ncbi:acetylcholinesterase-like [Ylistrum balloti]|uniref:acetylcholinesterase-like n=1 Tax=Ylistrum balloti TaxID=509963 RepID=UPI0029058342|nr:acetylcholinesterase-like [Ylistrum balloti]
MKLCMFTLLFVSGFVDDILCTDYRIVHTPSGPIRGIGVPYEGETVYQYRNIPYAKPPVGDLRLQKPVPHQIWTDIFDATVFGPSCLQDKDRIKNLIPKLPNPNFSEDCLQLNVYTPSTVLPQDRKSVMIWVHGGAFLLGQASYFDSTRLVTRGDVIIVTLNYRLGALGFLSTSDDGMPGNFGLWDQRLAFQWVKQNIASFGGDPNSITIFGQSAGAFSVGLHAMMPINRGLFTRVISESGGLDSKIAVRQDPKPITSEYGRVINCTQGTDTDTLVRCLRGKTFYEIIEAQNSLNSSFYGGDYNLEFMPVIDGVLIKEMPGALLSNFSSEEYKFFKSLDIIFGTSSNDGGIAATIVANRLQEKYRFNTTLEIPTVVLRDEIAPKLAELFYNNNEHVSRAIFDMYSSTDTLEQSKNVLNLFTDYTFLSATVSALNSHSATSISPGKNTFQYIFSGHGAIAGSYVLPVYFTGAWHGAELPFLFGQIGPGTALNNTANNRALADMVVSYWTNFAKHGNPNGQGLPIWPTYNPITAEFLNISVTPSTGSHVAEDRMRFWNKYIPSLLELGASAIVGK